MVGKPQSHLQVPSGAAEHSSLEEYEEGSAELAELGSVGSTPVQAVQRILLPVVV
jgi:hypothetical protein